MNDKLLLLWALGPSEMVLLAVAALFIFGPKRLPELGQALGEGLSSFRNASQGPAKPLSPPSSPSLPEPEPAA
ncbi:MAG: twin-arginine translocase TatA/TatE family subunit [Candidatus Eremiobacteraeota bacterium]|nr:twin-arginine translocase TatA/TatE family subunit [Candidatus Eremiobacteraeota bacterium]MCW5868755.1 twin-arginine translocase TatA/TatE family subunit [Candidatus Eremiobacteraeota bacterium]